jgi:hypothetical protein
MALTSWLASAADIDGKWTAETQRKGGGQVTETLVLKANGEQAHRDSRNAVARRRQISEGVINGNECRSRCSAQWRQAAV